MAAVEVHVSSDCMGEQVVRLLVQAGYLIQSVLHLAGSVALDTARKLSLEVLAGTSRNIKCVWYKQF